VVQLDSGDENMSRNNLIIFPCLLTVLNILALVINTSLQSKAATPSYREMINDPNFTRAVKTIIEQCRVNVDIGKVQCQSA
jgi:hypothetical protein